MPRSFSCWNDRRRPDPRLFSVPSSSSIHGEEDDDDDSEGVSSLHDLEDLVDSLLDDGQILGSQGLPNAAAPASIENASSPLASWMAGATTSTATEGAGGLAVPPAWTDAVADSTPSSMADSSLVETLSLFAPGGGVAASHENLFPPQVPLPPTALTASSLQGPVPPSSQASSQASTVSLQPPALPSPSAQPSAAQPPAPPVDFTWHACQSCLVTADCHGTPIEPRPLPDPNFKLHVTAELSPPLLYWADRRQWMWHKKWALPTLTVRVSRDHGPGGPPARMADAPSLYIMVTAGTLRDAEPVLRDQGLGGVCQRALVLPPNQAVEVSFTRLVFQQTSFNCGNRPFRLVVSILSAPPNEGQALPEGKKEGEGKSLIPLACYCSCSVHVDARKRSKGERPEAKDDDVRLVQRQRPGPETEKSQGQHSQQQQGPHYHQQGQQGQHGQAHSQQQGQHNQPRGGPQQQQQGGGLSGWLANFGWGGGSGGSSQGGGPSHPSTAVPPNPALMDATGDAFLEVRADGVIVNFLSSTVFGYAPSELLGRSILTVCHPDDHAALLQTLQALLVLHAGGSDNAHLPRSVRVIHRVVVGLGKGSDRAGLGGQRRPETIAADTILTMTRSALAAGMKPQTIIMCSRCALPIAADPTSGFSFQVLG